MKVKTYPIIELKSRRALPLREESKGVSYSYTMVVFTP